MRTSTTTRCSERSHPRLVRVCIALSGLLASSATSGCGDGSLEGVRWACERDDDCGSGATCRLGLCVASDRATPTGGLVCEVATDDAPARFTLSGDGGTRTLLFSANGHVARFDLPADVVSLDAGPLEACCVNACCGFRE